MTTTCPASLVIQEQDDLVLLIFGFVDFPTLIRIQRVCMYWREMVQQLIPTILGNRMFLTNGEHRERIRQYLNNKLKYADELARTYGWPIGKWNVSQVTDFSNMFYKRKDFNEDISEWDMSSATNLSYMFYGAQAFNQDLSKWCTSKVTNMNSMFKNATSFNGDISRWDISKVTNMNYMFAGARSFNQNVAQWHISSTMVASYGMFISAMAMKEENKPVHSMDIEEK